MKNVIVKAGQIYSYKNGTVQRQVLEVTEKKIVYEIVAGHASAIGKTDASDPKRFLLGAELVAAKITA